MKRTQEEIDAQIAGLRKMREGIPETSGFGDNNHLAIDAQISILESKEDIETFEDENDEGDCSDHMLEAANEADNWLNHGGEQDLFDEMWFPENVEKRK